jgi:hypothetical protein
MPVAKAPFNDTTADIIIRSKDGVNFYVHSLVLSLASPFFKTMFTLPQATCNETTPTIDVTEDSRTLDRLLRFCYPIDSPSICGLADTADVLEAAIKYEMAKPTKLMRSALIEFASSEPRQVFIVAIRLRLDLVAEFAATVWREDRRKVYSKIKGSGAIPSWTTLLTDTYLPEMVDISAGAYFRLLRFTHDKKDDTSVNAGRRDRRRSSATTTVPARHPLKFEGADIVLRSSDNIDFHVHKAIISLISPSLLENESAVHDNLPVFDIPENGQILATLLELCYPIGDPDAVNLEPPDLCAAVLQAAQKFKCSRALSLIKKHYGNKIKTNPLRVYFTAMQFGWEAEARKAALFAASRPIENVYVPEMESVSATAYYHLMEYCHRLRSRISKLIRPHQSIYHVHHQVWSLQGDTYCQKHIPRWWYMDHQDADSLSAWLAALVVENLQLHKHDDCGERPLLRESGELAAKIEEGLLEIQLEINDQPGASVPTSQR